MDEAKKKGINTPYDSAFKSIIKKCPRMSLFLINEMFYKTGLIDEEYDGTEKLELLDKEIPSLDLGELEMDLRLAVFKGARRTFHMECQSTPDGTIILRMIQYNTRAAIEEADYTRSCIRIKIDDAGIVFLRSTRNTPQVMTVILEVPQNGSVSYQLPVIRMQGYTLDYLIENRLFILLPFIFFNYEKQLKKAPRNKALYGQILDLYDTILSRLKELADSDTINAYEASTLYDSLKTVFEALGKTNKAEQEVRSIMGGKILEYSADKYFDAGKAEGEAKGRAEGEAKGRAEGEAKGRAEGIVEGEAKGKVKGEQKYASLVKALIALGRTDDIGRSVGDKEFRDSLYKEFNIDN